MAKPSHREKLLQAGMRVVHARGFGGASVRDVVQAAGVPQGSFTNHFKSKEAFGLAVVELYAADAQALALATLGDDALPPLRRLRAYFERATHRDADGGLASGCLLGNLTAEANDCGDAIRRRVVEALARTQAAIAGCLRAALQLGEIDASTDCEETAAFVLAAFHGALLLAKAQRSALPLERFEAQLFGRLLRAGPH